jgi:hypothetical protein
MINGNLLQKNDFVACYLCDTFSLPGKNQLMTVTQITEMATDYPHPRKQRNIFLQENPLIKRGINRWSKKCSIINQTFTSKLKNIMKKQIKKLSLNKRTISNLCPSQMNRLIGGFGTKHCGGGGGTTEVTMSCGSCYGGCTITCKGHTCHNNCI